MTFRCGHPRSADNSALNGKKTGVTCRKCKNARQRRTSDTPEYRAAAVDRWRKRQGGLKGNACARKTHCPKGHGYTPENTYTAPDGRRQCKTCRCAARKTDYAKHRVARLEAMAEWRAANHDRFLETNRAWRLANPERVNLISRLKKQRRRNAGVLTAADWQAVLDLYGTDCLACGSDAPPTIDHVIPIIRGGSNTSDNVQPLCRDCNTRKGTNIADYRPHLVATI